MTEKERNQIVSDINKQFLKQELTKEDALNILKDHFPRTTFVLCVDDGQFHRKIDAFLSFPSQTWYHSRRDFIYVNRDALMDAYCHRNDADKIGFLCENSGTWFHNEDFTRVNCEGDMICLEYALDNDEIESRNGQYRYIIRDTTDETGRADYHSTRRLRKNLEGIGVELEIECHGEMADFCAIARKQGILTEYDGSLDDDYGVELIGPVLPFAAYHKMEKWDKVFEVFDKFECKGHDAGTKYGIHVSLSLSMFSELELSKFVLFFNTCSALCKVVAQRDAFYIGKYGAQQKHKKFKKTQTGKYEAVRVDTVRAEVRIFRSTTRKDRFLKNIEFCEAVRLATREMSAQEVLQEVVASKKFFNFVQREKKTYPNLYNFFVEKDKIIKKKKMKEGTNVQG